MKLIPLTQGKFAKVDDADFERLSGHKCFAKKTTAVDSEDGSYYAARSARVNGSMTTIYMHREITNCPAGKVFDHKNHDRLDNRQENLRVCTRREHNNYRHN